MLDLGCCLLACGEDRQLAACIGPSSPRSFFFPAHSERLCEHLTSARLWAQCRGQKRE